MHVYDYKEHTIMGLEQLLLFEKVIFVAKIKLRTGESRHVDFIYILNFLLR